MYRVIITNVTTYIETYISPESLLKNGSEEGNSIIIQWMELFSSSLFFHLHFCVCRYVFLHPQKFPPNRPFMFLKIHLEKNTFFPFPLPY